MLKLAPSLLSADFANLKEEIESVEKAGAQYLHLDIMDGVFVPNITFGAPLVKSIRKVSNMIFDVHLMITDPAFYIDDFCKAGADIINFHAEACFDINCTLEKIKEKNVKAGITLRPHTNISLIEKYLKDVDLVLIMSVEPGFGGQKLIPETLKKIKELAKIKKENNYNFEIEIDGGVNINNVKEVIDAGAEVIVAGSAVFGSGNNFNKAKGFLDIFKEYDIK